jgi:hypothetical protein
MATACSYCPKCGGRRGCCCVCNPSDYVCCPHTEKETVAKECWNVKFEPVCIPAFKWPWECCGPAKCGRVRCVNVLESEEYECDECVTTWSVRRVCGCCGACRGSAEAATDATSASQPTDAAQQGARSSSLAAAWRWLRGDR